MRQGIVRQSGNVIIVGMVYMPTNLCLVLPSYGQLYVVIDSYGQYITKLWGILLMIISGYMV